MLFLPGANAKKIAPSDQPDQTFRSPFQNWHTAHIVRGHPIGEVSDQRITMGPIGTPSSIGSKRPETRAWRMANFVAMLARGETVRPLKASKD